MSAQHTYLDWENLVKKQLKTDDIYSVLCKDNLEGICIKPYYNYSESSRRKLPKIAESTHLVSKYSKALEDDVFAFVIDENVEPLLEKIIFVQNQNVNIKQSTENGNQYFSLIDVFDESKKELNTSLAKELLSKGFIRSICIDIASYQNSGAAIYQQLGIALAKVKELTEIFGSEILEQLIFKVAVGSNYFFEISKIRALKLLFNQYSKEFGLDLIPYIFVETSLRNKAKNDAENNLIRSTLELAAAMIGGADAVYSNDFKLNNSTELSEEISFKQQIVLAYESIINVFEDAANGSYYVEEITDQIANKSWKYFLEIEENGGYLEVSKNGILSKQIFEHAVAEQNWVAEGKIKLIGVNLYPKLEATKTSEQMYSVSEIKPVRWAEMFE